MALDISRIQAVCLDIDGTLMDTDDQMVRRLSGWLARLQFIVPERDPEKLARRIIMGIESPANALLGMMDRLGLDDKLAALDELTHRTGWRKPPKAAHMIPGSREALGALRSRYRLAVVSARGSKGVGAFLEHFDLTPLFSVIVTGQTRPLTKPHPDPILWAARQLGIAPGACVMVGDTRVDILSGKAAGAQTVGVLCGFGRENELRAAGADLILPSTANLPEILLDGGDTPGTTP